MELIPSLPPSDAEVVRMTLKDPNQYGLLVERYEAKLQRYIARLGVRVHDDQLDVLQEIFIKAYRNLNSFDTSLSFSSWIDHGLSWDFNWISSASFGKAEKIIRCFT